MKTWPTEEEKEQALFAAKAMTFSAIADGIVMVFKNFDSRFVVCEIVLVVAALIRWNQWFHIQTLLDVKEMLSQQCGRNEKHDTGMEMSDEGEHQKNTSDV